jgi:hypothetical protein
MPKVKRFYLLLAGDLASPTDKASREVSHQTQKNWEMIKKIIPTNITYMIPPNKNEKNYKTMIIIFTDPGMKNL